MPANIKHPQHDKVATLTPCWLQAFVPGNLVLPQPDAGLGRAATASPAIAAQLAHLAQLSEQLKVWFCCAEMMYTHQQAAVA